jgi:hypothetical protein
MLLTDGSGASGRSRLSSSTALLDRAGGARGPIFGRFSDGAMYRAVLETDTDLFVGIVDEITDVLVRTRVACVVGDAAEGYNPTHDVCRLLINTAVAIAQRIQGREIANFAFPLVGRPDGGVPDPARALRIELEAAAFERKLQAARAYIELADEVATALNGWGTDVFRREYLFAVNPEGGCRPAEIPPHYERYGEKRVAAGAYERVIRYEQHVRPLAEILSRYAGQAGRHAASGA